MRVGNNITLYAGEQPTNAKAFEENAQESRKTVFAGSLNQNATLQDRIEQRKAQAQKEALKVVGDVFAADRAMDADMESRRQHVKELEQERGRL